ncbi:hypothetical protein AVEN_78873-1 [Araneus ventricosus]|uniref:Uncharacterized protein n=1 Tax=Araneus ventricosus TaxID=182803 RepID=A0A4Y2UKW1_ARAVE|nr:hypothetical protein AVEN_78873-1 [Araneus ventricosus]
METNRRRRGSLHRSTGGNNYWYEPSYRRNSMRVYREYPRSRNGHRHPRDSGDLVVYFVLFFICLFAMNSGNLPHETGPPVDEPFPASKCETLLPECECDDYEEIAGLFCENVSDFQAFTKILEDGSLFENGTTYEITLSGTRVLPRQFLKGLIVYRLYIDDPQTEGLEDGAFDGVLRLRRFHVRISSITVSWSVFRLVMYPSF